MYIKLLRNWFFNGVRYRAKDRASALFIREVPDDYLGDLPSDTQVFDEKRNLLGTAKELRAAGKPKLVAAEPKDEEDDDKALKAAQKAVDDAKKEVTAADAAVKASATDANVKAANAAKAALAKAETDLAGLKKKD